MPDMTLEQAQARILELTEQNENLIAERDMVLQDNESLRSESEELRKLNQKYFNKLIAQDKQEEEKVEDEPVPTCEEFAAKLNI